MSDKTILNVEGMTCSNCALGISRFLEKQGLHQINVDLASGEVIFEQVEESKIETIKKGINDLGFTVINENADSSLAKTPKYTSLEIIGAKSFHCPVRDGKEWGQLAMVIRHKG